MWSTSSHNAQAIALFQEEINHRERPVRFMRGKPSNRIFLCLRRANHLRANKILQRRSQIASNDWVVFD